MSKTRKRMNGHLTDRERIERAALNVKKRTDIMTASDVFSTMIITDKTARRYIPYRSVVSELATNHRFERIGEKPSTSISRSRCVSCYRMVI